MSRLDKLSDASVKTLRGLLKASASKDEVTRVKAVTQFLNIVELPIRQGTVDGDNTQGIFRNVTLEPGVTPEFPLDPVRPGTENEFRAYTHTGSGTGFLPQRTLSGDKVLLPKIKTANSIDWPLDYAREARWDIVSRAMEVFMAGFTKKRNDDAWHTILKAVSDRGMTIFDKGANQGQFTKRLFSMVKCAMTRNAGGNSASLKRGKATDMWVSCEAIQEILNWNLEQIPDSVRAQFYAMQVGENTVMDICGLRLHEMFELGVGQEYQTYYTSTLGASLVPSTANSGPVGHSDDDVELGVCLDLLNDDSFVMASTQPLEVYEDPYLHRAGLAGMYGWEGYALLVADSRRALAFSF